MSPQIPHYINGEIHTSTGNPLPIFNPNEGKEIAHICPADLTLIRQTIHHAQTAQTHWAKTPALKRAKILRQFANLLEQRETDLASIVSQEHGKTLSDAKASIQRGLELLHYHCGIQEQLQGRFSPHVSQHVHTLSLYQPLGICAGIAPFNFPVMVPMWLMIPAIASGNAFILKPSEKTPSAALKLVEWLSEAGLPPGIANCLQGDATTVQHLLEQEEIQAYSAVGSTKAAKHIYTEACQRGKRAATFGGAKNHAVVMPDANLEQAADAIISAAYGSSGQRCMAISVVVTIDDQTPKKLIPLFMEGIQRIKLGKSNEADVDMGPVNSLHQLNFLHQAIEEGIKQGAQLIFDGRTLPKPNPHGYFLGPCLFDAVTTEMKLYQQELFGPILIILRLSSFKQALDTIAENPYGNGAVIFTQSGKEAQNFIEGAQAGMIGINIPIPVPIVSHPFGGWKQSSFGAHGMHGQESLNFYTKNKSITLAWPEQSQTLSLNMPHL
jgi:malonate-semialdehyde dehydrogenase (acetylating)/methylmalonate-semialdehyde dehydrogenase